MDVDGDRDGRGVVFGGTRRRGGLSEVQVEVEMGGKVGVVALRLGLGVLVRVVGLKLRVVGLVLRMMVLVMEMVLGGYGYGYGCGSSRAQIGASYCRRPFGRN